MEQKDPGGMVLALEAWLRTTIAQLQATLQPSGEV
jgi:hypothetical protein